MENSVIVLDSSDDETDTNSQSNSKTPPQIEPICLIDEEENDDDLSDSRMDSPSSAKQRQIRKLNNEISKAIINKLSNNPTTNRKRKLNDEKPSSNKIRRIAPTKISDKVSKRKDSHLFDDNDEILSSKTDDSLGDEMPEISAKKKTDENRNEEEKTPITAAFATLLDACKKADTTDDMEVLIKKKLIPYYETVHPDFVNSKSFTKTCLTIADDINANPSFVYLKVSGILEELNIRRKSGQTVMSNEDVTSTGNARKDFQIKRLNHALYILKKKIAKLDEADVDLDDDDNSTYLLVERYKKRACEIYEKICDITGESKHAHRLVRKPITFQGTHYPEFNRTIQAFVNRTKTFPDMFDVLRCLEHCNNQYGFRLNKEQIKTIAQDAFIKIGKSLQKRRKTDLYETVSYFTGTENDPAQNDVTLQTKLNENQKYHLRINEIIDKYAAVQDKVSSIPNTMDSSSGSKSENEIHLVEGKDNKENQISNGINDDCVINDLTIESHNGNSSNSNENSGNSNENSINNDDDEEYEEDDDEDEGNEEEHTTNNDDDNTKMDDGIIISDDEELMLS